MKVCAVMGTVGDVSNVAHLRLSGMSFFSKSRLSLQKRLLLMHFWSRDCPMTDAADEVEVTEKSAVQVFQYFQEVCSWRLVSHDQSILRRTI